MVSLGNWILTNDDGLGAPGLEALFVATEGMANRVIVAPLRPHSCGSHAVTTDREIEVSRWDEDRLTVDGTPADCVRVAIHHLVKDADLLISGINAGGNLGTDTYHSGTVAAAREGALHGLRAVAISHYLARGREVDWARAGGWARRVIEELLLRPWPVGTFWNVNMPHPELGGPEPRLVECELDPSPLPLSYKVSGNRVRYDGNYHLRRRVENGDVEVCFRGDIALSQIRLPWAFAPGEVGPDD